MKRFFLFFFVWSVSCFADFTEKLVSFQEIDLKKSMHLEGWCGDFTDARKWALETHKPLLIAFLGPSWCKLSDQIEQKVLSDNNFLQALKDQLVLVKIDIPENFERLSHANFPEITLKEKYHIQECPSLVLIEASGHEIAKLECHSLETNHYVARVKELLQDFDRVKKCTEKRQIKQLKVDELKSLYAKAGRLADHKFKENLLKQGLKTDPGAYFLLEKYGEILANRRFKSREVIKIRKKIVARDPQHYEAAQVKLAILDFGSLAHGVKKPKNSHTVIKPLVKYLKEFGMQDKENAWRLELMISQYLFGNNHIEEALEHAKQCLDVAPASQKTEIAHSVEYLQAHLPSKR